ncbi:hypothetical protein [Puniceibacterium sediminis]|nr:hypothetical protein [Puniceibacterium sediminis]
MSFFDTSTARTLFLDMMRLDGLRQSLDAAVANAMPENTLEDEFTEAVLFVLSIRLNRLTGGAADMTFSARCHITSTRAQWLPKRMAWGGMRRVIDLYCAAFRGEVLHCETAWYNHQSRVDPSAKPERPRTCGRA